MRYAREYERLAKRMADAVELEEAWKDVEEVYGKKATEELKELTPADPLLLHDLMVISHLGDGKTKKEVQDMLNSYTEKDWENDMKNFGKTIKLTKDTYYSQYRKVSVGNKKGLKNERSAIK